MADLVDITELVSLPEAARRLDLHRATVNEMVHDGRLAGVRVGPHWYVRERDLEEFAESYTRPKNSPRRRDPRHQAEWRDRVLIQVAEWHSATAQELDRVIDLHIGNIRKYLCLAEQDGLVARDEFGTWTLTDEGARHLRGSDGAAQAS